MTEPTFKRARSTAAKDARAEAILRSAREQALQRGVREVTLTDVASGIGMHKSTMLRYFETREAIFLHLTASEWADWAAAAKGRIGATEIADPTCVADALSSTLVQRPLFCDLLAHAPLNLERGVSLPAVKDFKLTALDAARTVATELEHATGLGAPQARNVVATATAMAGALWQMAAPGTALRSFYEADAELEHAVIDVGPRLYDILRALVAGYLAGE